MEKLTKYENEVPNIEAIKNAQDSYLKELSKNPNQKAIKRNEFANNAEYLEIGYIEAQLDRLFLNWDWEVQNVQQIANGIVVNGNLTVTTYTGTKIKRSGVAGVEIQTIKGATELNPSTISRKAMDRDAGRADAYALKNAASKLGNAFGRSLNRGFKFEHQPNDELLNNIYKQPNQSNHE